MSLIDTSITIDDVHKSYKVDTTLRRKQAIRDHKRLDAIATFRRTLCLTYGAIQDIANDLQRKRAFDVLVARVCLDAIDKPEGQSPERIFNRLFGKPTETSISLHGSADQLANSPFALAIKAAIDAKKQKANDDSSYKPLPITDGRSENEMNLAKDGDHEIGNTKAETLTGNRDRDSAPSLAMVDGYNAEESSTKDESSLPRG